jgi:hypothetical protein
MRLKALVKPDPDKVELTTKRRMRHGVKQVANASDLARKRSER